MSLSQRNSCSGQAMVEFALAIPLLLLTVFAVVYFGRAFVVSQAITYACQQGALQASRIPNLNDPGNRDMVRGFSTSGEVINSNSVIYSILAGSQLLSGGNTGNLPPQSAVKILPWDSDGSPGDYTPPGTIGVRIDYPFQLMGSPFSSNQTQEVDIAMSVNGQGNPVRLPNLVISERASASQEVYQE